METLENNAAEQEIANLPILNCFNTTLTFGEDEFEILFCNSEITISRDRDNYAVVRLKNQQVPYKTTILGGFAFAVEKTGTVDYKKYFDIRWEDDLSIPDLVFHQKPSKIKREYEKGQNIELGVEDVGCYRVIYQDNVTADFSRVGEGAYDFNFSSGFNGSINKEPDGTHTIRFKGHRWDADEDGYNSESKFIISRSKYTDNLLLILQDKATVLIEH